MQIIYTHDEALNLIADKHCCATDNVKIEGPVYVSEVQFPLAQIVEFMVKYNFIYDESDNIMNKITAIGDLRLHCENLGLTVSLFDSMIVVNSFIELKRVK